MDQVVSEKANSFRAKPQLGERIYYADLSRQEIIDLVLGAPRPHPVKIESIYFFGSRARGDNTWDSDYDILLVLSGEYSKEERRQLSFQVNVRFAEAHASVDSFLIHMNEIPHYQKVFGIGEHIREALETGVVIYQLVDLGRKTII